VWTELIRDYWVCGLCPPFSILKNTVFRKPDLFLSSGEWVGETSVGSVREELTSITRTVQYTTKALRRYRLHVQWHNKASQLQKHGQVLSVIRHHQNPLECTWINVAQDRHQ
jgi:hypothetical protein